MNSRTVRQVLAAACVASVFLLVGCDNSNNSAAQVSSEKAAGRALSAGEPRATDKLFNEASNENLQKDLEGRAQKGSIAEYVQTNTPDVDLNAAIQEIQGAMATDPEPLIKVGLESQLGSTQLRLSDVRMSAVRADIAALNQRAASILALAQTVKSINNEIAILEAAKEQPAVDAAAAAAMVTQRQGELAKAKAKVADLQKSIADMESQARQIYAATDTAFAASEQLKGKAAIEAATKAMNDRSKAEELMAEVTTRGPVLAEAQAQATLAELSLNEAQETAKIAQAANAQSTAAADSKAKRLAGLRETAAKIVDANGQDKENGLTGKVAAYIAKFNEIDKKIKDAAAPAEKAADSFGSASRDFSTLANEMSRKADEMTLDQNDVLRKVYRDDRTTVLLTWSQAAAQQQAGNVYLAGVQAYDLLAKVSEVAGQAKVQVDAKFADPKALASSANRQEFAKSATKSFDDAVKTVGTANARSGADIDKIRWMGYSLAATANQGAYLAGNAGALEAAKKAKNDAIGANPALESTLNWVGQ
jgi:hypothetical protein